MDSARKNALLGWKCLSISPTSCLYQNPYLPCKTETLTSLYTYQPPPNRLRYLIQRAPGQLLNSANVDLEKISRVQDLQMWQCLNLDTDINFVMQLTFNLENKNKSHKYRWGMKQVSSSSHVTQRKIQHHIRSGCIYFCSLFSPLIIIIF